jgi:hypothetical protein
MVVDNTGNMPQLSAIVGHYRLYAEPYGNISLYGCNIAGHAPATQLPQHIAGKYYPFKRTFGRERTVL